MACADGNNLSVAESTNVNSLCPDLAFSFKSPPEEKSENDAGTQRPSTNYFDFPETDADAAAFLATPTPTKRRSFSEELFSPGVSTSDLCNNIDSSSTSLPILNDISENKIDTVVLKTLLNFVLDACRKLFSLYSSLDDQVQSNARFTSEKVSVLHLLHQNALAESLKECRDYRREQEVSISQKFEVFARSNAEVREQWTEQMDLLKQNIHNEVHSDHSEDDDSDNASNDSRSSSHFSNGVVQNLEAEMNGLNETLTKISKDLLDMDTRVIECEQYPRRNNIVISGIPDDVSHRDLKNEVFDILAAIGLNELTENDISACHRLPKSRRSRWPAKTIIRFVNRDNVDFCLRNRNRLKERAVRNKLDGMNLRFYENLCKSNSLILRMCKWLEENEHIHGHFLRNGYVKIIVTEGDNPVKMTHPQVLRDRFPFIPLNLNFGE